MMCFCFVRCTLKSSKRHSLRLIFYLPECRNANFVNLCRWQEEDFLKERSLSLPFHVYEALQSYYYVLNLMLTYIHDVVEHWYTMVGGKKNGATAKHRGWCLLVFTGRRYKLSWRRRLRKRTSAPQLGGISPPRDLCLAPLKQHEWVTLQEWDQIRCLSLVSNKILHILHWSDSFFCTHAYVLISVD